jgi:L-malate glycosyltransferase
MQSIQNKDTRKVLIIYKWLPKYRVDFYQQLRNKLLKNNIELHLIYGKSNKLNTLKKDEAEIEWGKYIPNRILNVGKKELIWQPCLQYLKDKDLIIVQTENKLILNYILIIIRPISKFKLAFWAHVNNMQDDANSLRNKFKLLFNNKCDWWFGYTKSAKLFLTARNYPENRITVVQNAIDTITLMKYYSKISEEELNDLKESLNIIGNNIGIFCGGMYPDKDFEFILATCVRVKTVLSDFHMIFIGSGIESSKIINASNKMDWVHFIGPKFGIERIIYFKISAIQLMPRLVGLCILDSFAMETPLITTDHPFHGPEIDYLENGVNGIMTKNNLNDFSNSIIDILNSQKYLHLIEGGKLAAEKYTVENMAENFNNGILACLNT